MLVPAEPGLPPVRAGFDRSPPSRRCRHCVSARRRSAPSDTILPSGRRPPLLVLAGHGDDGGAFAAISRYIASPWDLQDPRVTKFEPRFPQRLWAGWWREVCSPFVHGVQVCWRLQPDRRGRPRQCVSRMLSVGAAQFDSTFAPIMGRRVSKMHLRSLFSSTGLNKPG